MPGGGLRTNMLVAAGATLFVLYSATTPGPNNTQIGVWTPRSFVDSRYYAANASLLSNAASY